jgi:hypothetical protein
MKYWINWDSWTLGDCRIATKLYDIVPNKIYIDKVLTQVKRAGLGLRKDIR